MILDQFTDLPDYPFDHFHEQVSQFISAQSYWLSVLRSAYGFDGAQWLPVDGGADLADLQYTGSVVAVRSIALVKQINIQTTSTPAHANMLATENPGYSDADMARLQRDLGPDFTLDDQARRGLTPAEALAAATADADLYPVTIFVEPKTIWLPRPNHPQGGVEQKIELLSLTGEISPRAEPLALQALELFLEPGPSSDRVNVLFSDADGDPRKF